MNRVFVVGFPRSGTTLVQGVLAASDSVLSFPETHYFRRGLTAPVWKRMLFGRRGQLDEIIGSVFNVWSQDALWQRIRPQLPDSIVERFDFAITTLAEEEGKDAWVEKTPSHLYAIDEIQTEITSAQFVHVLREPIGAVKSYYRATHENPKAWNGKVSVPKGVARWNCDLERSLRYLDDPRHHMLKFDELVANPTESVQNLCDFLNLPFSPSLLSPEASYEKIVLPWEKWKANNNKPIGYKKSATKDDASEWDSYIRDHCKSWDEVT